MPAALFAAGYLLAWGGFSLAATLAQWALERAALLSPMDMTIDQPAAGRSAVPRRRPLPAHAGKAACLRVCRSPLDFIVNHWRDGSGGAVRMGMTHGLYCLGCCWILMLLLFVGGVMNLLWVAALAGVVLIEKVTAGPWIGRIGGALLAAYGARLLAMG